MQLDLGQLRPHGLAKRERIGSDTGIEELDFECSVHHGLRLPHQLIEAAFLHAAPAIGVYVRPMVGARSRPIDFDAKPYGLPRNLWHHDKVEVASVEPIGYAPGRFVQRCELATDRPDTRQAPSVERQRCAGLIAGGRILPDAAGGSEVASLAVSDIGLAGTEVVPVSVGLWAFAADYSPVN